MLLIFAVLSGLANTSIFYTKIDNFATKESFQNDNLIKISPEINDEIQCIFECGNVDECSTVSYNRKTLECRLHQNTRPLINKYDIIEDSLSTVFTKKRKN